MTRGRGSFKFSDGDAADFQAVAEACRKHGKALGLPAPGAKAFALAEAEGARYVTVSDDITALRLGFSKGLEVAGRRES
jgi:2-keto-3-deoxy-L-rhamnonate aldolase RhmA